MSILQKSNSRRSARQQINIKAVNDGILVLPGDEYRLILQASSINFELRSEAEQDSLIENYQSFLNALPCRVQIIIRVREMDMEKYLENFTSKLKREDKPVYQEQIKNYGEFVSRLITSNKILARSFYIVLPFKAKDTKEFEITKEQLNLSREIIGKGLGRLGMHTRTLSSLEILDLFYSFYNPEQAKTQSVTDQTLQLLKQAYL